jgi:hypothetical protein
LSSIFFNAISVGGKKKNQVSIMALSLFRTIDVGRATAKFIADSWCFDACDQFSDFFKAEKKSSLKVVDSL